eukprot:scaffold21032_cov78-Skeletonema_dohrnii-CCMP3373.AAC.1
MAGQSTQTQVASRQDNMSKSSTNTLHYATPVYTTKERNKPDHDWRYKRTASFSITLDIGAR